MKLICLLLIIYPVFAEAITSDELRLLSGGAEQAQREKAGRFKHGDLQGIVDNTVSKTKKNILVTTKLLTIKEEEKQVDQIKIIRQTPRVSRQSTIHTTTSTNSVTNPDIYIPPSRVIVKAASTTDAVFVDRKDFGIKLGSWVNGRLSRNINNRENGLIVITIVKDLKGKNNILVSGTQLFANKAYNSATKRLEMQIIKGVTPQGLEFDVSATIFDSNKVAGLTGIIKKKKVTNPSVKRGLLAGGNRLITDLAPNNVLGTVTSTTANTLIGKGNESVNAELVSNFIIYVTKQPVLVRVNETF